MSFERSWTRDGVLLAGREHPGDGPPVLLLHGAEDKLTSASASTEFVDMLASSDKLCKIYDGMYHELFNEPEQEDVLKTCCEWIKARVKHSDS